MKHIAITMEEPRRPLAMHPKKFALWLFIVSIVMIFAAITSAFIVRRGEGNWLVVEATPLMYINTGIILLSSITMHWALISARKDNLQPMKAGILVTTLLGGLFLIGQYMVWEEMQSSGIFFGGGNSNPGGSFVYVLTGLHGFHLITGLVFLLIVLIRAFQYKVHSKSLLSIEMCTTYWHFLDALWVYLFVFLLLNN